MFRILKIFSKTLLFALFCAAAFWASRAENPRSAIEELARLPDCDFAGLAESCWAEGKRAEAFACLEYAVSNKTGDADECAFLREKYLKSEELRNSAWGRLCAVGRGFATGDVDGADSLAGAALSDLLLYGDLRDIVKETAINDKADPFVLALASAGAATTLFPPADGALSLAKIAKRAGSLAAPLENSILRAVRSALKSPPAKAAEELKKSLGPISGLSKKTKTWTGFSAVLKSADSPEDISKICALLGKSPDNAAKLEQILFISGKSAKRSFDFIVENSQRGMDFLYSAMRKGPRAAEFAARHPSFAARAAKNAYKGYPLAAAEIADAATALFGKSEALRWLAVFCLSAAAFAAALPYGYIFSAAKEIDKARYRARAAAANVALDLLFVAVLRWGVASAALATVISQALSAVLSFRKLAGPGTAYRVRWRRVRFDSGTLRQVLGLGLPSGVQNSVISLANVIVQANINAFGSAAMAGCGAYSKVEGFAFLPITCFALALSTFVSQNVGAGRYDRVKQGMRFGLLCSPLLAEGVGLGMYLLAPRLIAAFNGEAQVVAYGVNYARTVALFYCLLAFSHCCAGLLRGLGRPVIPMGIMLAVWCVLRITYITLTVRVLPTIRVVYWAYPLTWGISSVLFALCLARLRFPPMPGPAAPIEKGNKG